MQEPNVISAYAARHGLVKEAAETCVACGRKLGACPRKLDAHGGVYHAWCWAEHTRQASGRPQLKVEVAANVATRTRGLMHRKSLAADAGMLFIFARPQPLSFYGRNTLIPLDIAFVGADRRITAIKTIQPYDETPVTGHGQWAIEANAGWFARNKIKPLYLVQAVHGKVSFMPPLEKAAERYLTKYARQKPRRAARFRVPLAALSLATAAVAGRALAQDHSPAPAAHPAAPEHEGLRDPSWKLVDEGQAEHRAAARYLAKYAQLKPGVELKPHQVEAKKRITAPDSEGQLLMHGLGTGKTLSSIAAVEDLKRPANVIVPAALRVNYRKDVDKFVKHPTVGAQGRYQIVSYDRAAKGGLPNRDVLVLDEVQRLRNQGNQYQGAFAQARAAKKRILLSGTPLVNGPGDLGSVINLLHGKQLYSPEEFEKKHVGEKVHAPFLGMFGQGKVEPVIHKEKDLRKLLEGRVHAVGDVGNTRPSTTTEDVRVTMSPLQDQLNRAMLGKLPFWLKWKFKHNLPPSKKQAVQLNAFMSGMRQVALSPHGFDKRLDPYGAFQESPKLQRALADVQAGLKRNEKSMLYSNFIESGLNPMAAALARNKIPHVMFHGGLSDAARKAAIEAYNTGKARVALLGPAGSEGISLKGTRSVGILDPHWNLARTQQAEGRAVRLDSHVDLPEEMRNVQIRRYFSDPRRGLLKRLFGIAGPVGSDQYLATRAEEKQRQLDVFNELLRKVGQ